MARRRNRTPLLLQWPFWLFWIICVYILQTQFGLGTLPAVVIGFPATFVFLASLAIMVRTAGILFFEFTERSSQSTALDGNDEKPQRIFVGVAFDEEGFERIEIETEVKVEAKNAENKTGIEAGMDSSVREFLETRPDN